MFLVAPLVLPGNQHTGTSRPRSALAANGKIVFVRGADGRHAQLWVVNPDRSGLAPLTALPGVSGFPAWSPDGRELVFAHAPRFASPPSPPSPLWSLYTIDKAGTGLRQLTRCRRPGCLQD